MRSQIKFPGHMADDGRTTVTLYEDGTPWPLKFHFARLRTIETNAIEVINVGFEIGDAIPMEPGTGGIKYQDGEEPKPIDPVTLERIVAKYADWVEYARLCLVIDHEGKANAIRRLRGPGRKPARLTEDFYRLIASEFTAYAKAGGHPGREIAAKYHVDPGTVSRWRKECRRLGLIEEES